MTGVQSKVVPLREQRRQSVPASDGTATLFQGVKVERPECPDWLSDDAKEHFSFVVGLLDESGLIAKIDMGMLTILASSFAGMKKAEEQMRLDGGEYQETPNGYMQLSPAAVSYDRHAARYEKVAKQFGITVRARQSIKIDNPNQGELEL
ncbi:MAG: phage terminase small subunit P27 family [Cellvibrionaceae bacterium]|nr:phage terminase small subunit P27 family [Cellvibrionaceae bacterium]